MPEVSGSVVYKFVISYETKDLSLEEADRFKRLSDEAKNVPSSELERFIEQQRDNPDDFHAHVSKFAKINRLSNMKKFDELAPERLSFLIKNNLEIFNSDSYKKLLDGISKGLNLQEF